MAGEECLKAACAFGAGMGRMQGVCGAVTGAFMALGMKYGSSTEGEEWKKQLTYRQVQEFVRKFEILHGSIICRNLLGCDISTDEGLKFAKESGLFAIKCRKYVMDSVEILESMMNDDAAQAQLNPEGK